MSTNASVNAHPTHRAGSSGTESGSPAAPAIEARQLKRSFGRFAAVDGVTFSIPTASLVAFLGPNGAGKSTTMRLLTGFLVPSSGEALVLGQSVTQNRVAAAANIGYLPENGPLPPEQTPMEVLRFLAEARGLATSQRAERIEAVIAQTMLSDVLGRPCGKLSKGFRQRVGLAAALLHNPPVLILDEPTAGLDPRQVDHLRTLLTDLARTRTILLSTHILSEVRAIAQRIIMIDRGRIVHDGSAGSLGSSEREMEERFVSLTRGAEKVGGAS